MKTTGKSFIPTRVELSGGTDENGWASGCEEPFLDTTLEIKKKGKSHPLLPLLLTGRFLLC